MELPRPLTLVGLGPLGIGRRRDPSLWREVALRAHVTRIYRLSDSRDGRWQQGGERHDGGPGYGFHPSLESAKLAASRHRREGSYWEIDEVPACAFIGSARSLLIAEPHASAPLAKHGYTARCKPYLIDIAARFHDLNPGLIHSFIAATTDLPVAQPPFRSWISTRSGPDRQLGWRVRQFPRFQRQALEAILGAIETHRRSLEGCAFLGVSLWNHPERGSLTIRRLHSHAPLAGAGLIDGDVIVGVETPGADGALALVTDRLEAVVPGDALLLRIRRGLDHFRVRHQVKSFLEVLQVYRGDALPVGAGDSLLA